MDPIPTAASTSSTAKMSTTIAAHPTIVLVVLTVLIILVIGMYVYYHGVFSIGKKQILHLAQPLMLKLKNSLILSMRLN
jgi:uncharacterized membrane protein affecting hemolysin expression